MHLCTFLGCLLTCTLLSPSVIDYCSFGNHSCDHECVSVLSGYHCQCNHGYRLLSDGRTCQGKL